MSQLVDLLDNPVSPLRITNFEKLPFGKLGEDVYDTTSRFTIQTLVYGPFSPS